MSEAVPNNMLPRGLLIGAGLLILSCLLLVTLARVTGYTPDRPAPSPVVESRDLRFEDRADGSIAVYAGADGALVDTLAPGTNGFVRGVLRGLARERRAEKVGPEAPFRLTHWADGRLSLDDPSTGRHVDLEVFGPTKSGAFADILTAGRPAKEK